MSRFTQHPSCQFQGQQVLGKVRRRPVQNATELLERGSVSDGRKQRLITVTRNRTILHLRRRGWQRTVPEVVNQLLWREKRSCLVQKQCVTPPC